MSTAHVSTGCEAPLAPQLVPRRRAASVESFLRRMAPEVRAEARHLVRACKRAADLATVFPAALHAICDDRMPPAVRMKARQLVAQGAPLKTVGEALSLPMWMRRLPPEAFHGGIPAIGGSDVFMRRIVGRLPSSRRQARTWLTAVAFGMRAADEDFAIWIADKINDIGTGDAQPLLELLAAYAWHSRNCTGAARALILVRWRPEMSLETAICAAKSWFNRVRLVCQLPVGAISDPWLAPGKVDAFEIVALIDSRSLLDEARMMANCADQYAAKLASDQCRLFGLRRGRAHLATIEIAPHPREQNMVAITQLKARGNLPASSEHWQAAYAWLAGQASLWRPMTVIAPSRPLSATMWACLFERYRAERAGAPWLVEVPASSDIVQLEAGLAELARRAGVISWLFR